MACCDTIEQSFAGVATTTVPIPAHWLKPVVDVHYYVESEDKWYPGTTFTTIIQVSPGVSVYVDHGGTATGIVKIIGEQLTT